MRDLPSGTVTFLFTDIEGSTTLLHELGEEAFAEALLEHRRILREAFIRHGGVEVDTQGDAFFVAFPTAPGAAEAASESQAALAEGPIRVRMGLHTGSPHLTPEGYVGQDLHKGARIASAGHGGQVLLSKETRDLIHASVTDLGEHRLKDFAVAVPIFQLGADRFPPLKTISNTNLPRPASSFVGRETEVAEIASLLRNGARLLTLTGPGGSGKTRLSIEAAAELVPEFKAGVFWVPLAPLRDPALVTETIGQTVGAKDGLADHIGEREMLLLVDNLEQVIDAAPGLASLVETCPNLRLLVTSRELLRVRGEREYAVPPLSDPEAVELFCARSQFDPNETIAELCRRLDNLPLAIELAAARTSVLSPGQILERLSKRLDLLKGGRDAEARQQTLRATIEWSYGLLTEDEKHLFARLSVFRSGCTLDAAEAVAEADLDVLQSLVDKSLLRHRDDRFWMLETIREFAAERLEDHGKAEHVRRRHADHYLAVAEEAFPHLRGDPKDWLDRLEAELDNLRAALDQFESSGETQLALQLAGALYRFWYMRGGFAEGHQRIGRLLAADDRPTSARARALNGAAVMSMSTGDPAISRAWSEEALALHRRLGDKWGISYSIYSLAMDATEEADWAAARPYFEESLARFRDVGDGHYTLLAGDGLAWVAGELGDLEARRRGHEEVLREARAQRDLAVVALQLDQLAEFPRDEGRVEEALAMLAEALRIKVDLEVPGAIVESLSRVAQALATAHRSEIAARLVGSSEALREEIGGSHSWVARLNQETIDVVRADLKEEAFKGLWEEGRKLTIDEAVALALDSVV